jgi:spermidine synthase
MKTLNHSLLLFAVIIIEGYIVLSSELLAIRQTIPYVGSGTDTVSIIIAAVLMPLAFGYQYGGRFKPHKIMGHHFTVRKKLVLNILIASIILIIGLSHESLRYFFLMLPRLGIEDRLAQTTIYSALVLVVPVYLLGQTVPLVSNFFSKQRLSKITGKMLFFSTVGSFLGAIFATLALMPTIGVHHTASLNFVLLAFLVILLSKKKTSASVIFSVILAFAAMYYNSDDVMKKYKIRKNNAHHTIVAGTISSGDNVLYLNRNNSSKYNEMREKHPYIEFAERVVIHPIMYTANPKDILVIGAGGFTFGHEDTNNTYTYVDIDKDLLPIAEKYILKEPIGENKTFVPKPARGFLASTDQKYDVIYLDAYLGGISIPEHLVTVEFFEQVKAHLKDNGILMTNFILSPNFNNVFTRNIDNTMRAVFPHVTRTVVGEHYNLWSESETTMANIAYIYRHETDYDEGHIYSDNRNTVFYDKPKKLSP